MECCHLPLEGSGRNYGRPHPEHELRYEIADEYLDVIKGLWDSRDDDAFVRDRETGVYVDKTSYVALITKGVFQCRRTAKYQPLRAGAASGVSGRIVGFRHPACR